MYVYVEDICTYTCFFFLLQEGFEAIFKTNTEQRIKLLDVDLLLYMVSNLYITNLSTDKK